MAKDQTRRINPKTLAKDLDALAVIKTLTPAYAPANAAFTVALMDTSKTSMTNAQGTEAVKKGDWEAARDGANSAEWAFHNLLLGAKDQVVAQYGEDSDQVQAIGLKKKSEYKRPSSGTTPTPTPTP